MRMTRLLPLLLALCCVAAAGGPVGAGVAQARLLVPMDLVQNDHLKAYGLAYWVLERGQTVEWLLNYRGGAFLLPASDRKIKLRVEADKHEPDVRTIVALADHKVSVVLRPSLDVSADDWQDPYHKNKTPRKRRSAGAKKQARARTSAAHTARTSKPPASKKKPLFNEL